MCALFLSPTRVGLTLLALASTLATSISQGFLTPALETRDAYRGDRFLIARSPAVPVERLQAWNAAKGCQPIAGTTRDDLLLTLSVPENHSVADLIAEYEASGLVEFAEPDYWIYPAVSPNDPSFRSDLQWGLANSGRNGGLLDADISAESAWGILNSAEDIIVAVIDSGIRATHEDLTENLWVNPLETPGNGRDDDGFGLIDDIHGFDAVHVDGDPEDNDGHGTHVSGIIGAMGNNRRGVAGVAWKVQIMALKFIEKGAGSTSDAMRCINYARFFNADIINASWGAAGRSRSMERTIDRARRDGIVFVTAAGNSGKNMEVDPEYPASYALDNLVVVASTDRRDRLSSSSNYGRTRVDLAAPGVSIYSTAASSDRSYQTSSGTSMAAPFVSGALALLMARSPGTPYSDLIQTLVQTVDPVSELRGRTVSGGRLNLGAALKAITPKSVPPPPFTLSYHLGSRPGNLLLLVQSEPNHSFAIESSSDFIAWDRLHKGFTDARGLMTLEIELVGSTPVFYRVAH